MGDVLWMRVDGAVEKKGSGEKEKWRKVDCIIEAFVLRSLKLSTPRTISSSLLIYPGE